MSGKKPRQYDTIKVKRLHFYKHQKDKDVFIPTYRYCDSCQEPADIEINLTKKVYKSKDGRTKSKEKKIICFCSECFDKFKKIISFF